MMLTRLVVPAVLVCAGRGADHLYGGAGDDRLYGGLDRLGEDEGGTYLEPDQVAGGPGDDYLDPGNDPRLADADESGYTGIVTYAGATSGVSVDLGTGTATGQGTDHIVDTPSMLLVGSPNDDTLVGSAADDTIDGGAGDDVIKGLGGNDQLLPEADVLHPPTDQDRVYGGPGDDSIYSFAGRDLLSGGSGSDQVVDYGRAPETVLGGNGKDSLVVTVSGRSGTRIDGGAGRNDLTIYDTLARSKPRVLLKVDLLTDAFDVETSPVGTGTIANVTRFTLMGAEMRYRFGGTDAAEAITDLDGGWVTAWMHGGDDNVSGYGNLDMGAGSDTVHASRGSTCRHWEHGYCGGVHKP